MTLENLRFSVLATVALAALTACTHAAGRANALWENADAETEAAGEAAPDAASPEETAPDAEGLTDQDDLLSGKTDANTDETAGEKDNGKRNKQGSGPGGFFDRDPSSEPTNLLAHSLAAVLVILVLGAAAIFVVKRLLPRLGISQGQRVRVLETVYLGPRKSLYVVQVGDRTLLVSGTRERLALLADVTGSVPPPDESDPVTSAAGPASRFRIPGFEPENA
jgi:flagellar biogenesis protein FliO